MVLPSHIPLLEGTEELCGGRGRAAGPAAEPPKRTGGSLARRYGGRPAARVPAPCWGLRGGEILPPFYCSRSPRLTFQNKRIQ